MHAARLRVALVVLCSAAACAASSSGITLLVPGVVLQGISFVPSLALTPFNPSANDSLWPANVTAEIIDAVSGAALAAPMRLATVLGNGTRVFAWQLGELSLNRLGARRLAAVLSASADGAALGNSVATSLRVIPAWLSALPPVLTIALAIATRQVLISLFAGVWLAALLLNDLNPAAALFRSVDTYWVEAMSAPGHPAIVLFTLFLGGCIAMVARMGGTAGLAALARKLTRSPRSTQLATLALGALIFFDDYSSILIAGNSLRPVLSGVGVSAAKFAMLIHAMGACLASLAPVSSWIGVEIAYIGAQYRALGLSGNAYIVCLQSIPLRFFPLLMIICLVLVVLTGRDLGPMRTHEARALALADDAPASGWAVEHAPLLTVPHAPMPPTPPTPPTPPARWANAVVPFGVIICATFVGLYVDGRESLQAQPAPRPAASLVNVVSAANSVNALLWASLLGCMAAAAMALAQRLVSVAGLVAAWLEGVRDIVEAVLILLLAWTLGLVVNLLGTASFLSRMCAGVPLGLLPTLVSLAAYLMSFATGTAFGTMSILFPLVVPLAASLAAHHGAEARADAVLQSVAAVLSGALFGNVASPIADNSVLASMASGCAVVDHTTTAAPYALLVAAVALGAGTLPVGFGLYPGWVGLLVGSAVLLAVLLLFGRPPPVRNGALLSTNA